MARIEWKDSYRLGVSALDADHRDLAGLINELHAACEHEERREAAPAILARLRDHVVGHFAREEALMEQLGYPAFYEHWNHHVETNRVLQRMLDHGGDRQSLHTVLEFMTAWFHDHVLGADMKLRGFFAAEGVADTPLPHAPRRGWLERLRGSRR